MAAAPLFALDGRRIWVAGHRGMVGSALVRRLQTLPVEILTASREQVDLRDQAAVRRWMAEMQPEVVVLAAATVGGIAANNAYPVDYLYDNLVMQTNVIEAAHRQDVAKLLFLGSSCIYPRLAPQPLREDSLLTGPLEPTNEWYAIAKIAGIKLCQAYRRQYGRDFISAMPTNLYGPGDNFDPERSHVAAALIARIHQAVAEDAAEVVLWGSGTPKREFLHVDDLADALIFLLQHYFEAQHINVGTGEEITIADLAALIGRIAGFRGRFVLDRSRPDGTPRKVMDVSRLTALGWTAQRRLDQGMAEAYAWYHAHHETVRRIGHVAPPGGQARAS